MCTRLGSSVCCAYSSPFSPILTALNVFKKQVKICTEAWSVLMVQKALGAYKNGIYNSLGGPKSGSVPHKLCVLHHSQAHQ